MTLQPRSPATRGRTRTSEAQRRDWLDALDYRRIVEPGAAHLAARVDLDEAGRAGLRQAHDAVAAARRPAEHRQADSRLHLTIAALTGSPPPWSRRSPRSRGRLHEMLLAIPVLEANIAHSDRQHATLVRAVLAGQPERARRDDAGALRRHRRAAARPGGLTRTTRPTRRDRHDHRNDRHA